MISNCIYIAPLLQKNIFPPKTYAVPAASGLASVKGINASGSIPCAASSTKTWVNQPLCSCCPGQRQHKSIKTDGPEGVFKQRRGVATSARGMTKRFCTTNIFNWNTRVSTAINWSGLLYNMWGTYGLLSVISLIPAFWYHCPELWNIKDLS